MSNSEVPLLVVTGVRKSFAGVPLLNDISFTLLAGSVTILTGRNGSGKSTLVNCLAGFDRNYEGDVVLCGANLRGVSSEERARLGLVRTFQSPHLFTDLEVVQNLQLAQSARMPALRSYFTSQAGQAPSEIIGEFELRLLLKRLSGRLSYGEMKTVNTARAFSTNAKVLLLDEPLASLHRHRRELVVQAIASKAQTGSAVLVVEHELQGLTRIADAHYDLVDGRLISVDRS